MKFFNFRQNNTFGSWDINEDVNINVIVEADSPESANEIAVKHGVYFNGCNNGTDCQCCGDRWNDCYGDGYEVAEIYGVPLVPTDVVERFEDADSVVYYDDGPRVYFNAGSSYSSPPKVEIPKRLE
jgi:hypothetical protein